MNKLRQILVLSLAGLFASTQCFADQSDDVDTGVEWITHDLSSLGLGIVSEPEAGPPKFIDYKGALATICPLFHPDDIITTFVVHPTERDGAAGYLVSLSRIAHSRVDVAIAVYNLLHFNDKDGATLGELKFVGSWHVASNQFISVGAIEGGGRRVVLYFEETPSILVESISPERMACLRRSSAVLGVLEVDPSREAIYFEQTVVKPGDSSAYP